MMATQYTRSLNGIYCPHWQLQWSCHCSHACIPVHSPWLPGYIDVMQTILIILTMTGLFPDTPHIYVCIYISIYVYTHLYIYVKRDSMYIHTLYIHIYIYMYMYCACLLNLDKWSQLYPPIASSTNSSKSPQGNSTSAFTECGSHLTSLYYFHHLT